MQQIEIHIDGRTASRIVGDRRFSGLSALLAGEKEVYLVCDRNAAWVADAVEAELPGRVTARRELVAREEGKDMATVLELCRWLLDSGASRKALLLAIGGGITTDLAGFAASIYKRGIRYANIPTTLLAQVDAGIGGKTGVNFEDYKNMLGVIVQPVFTYICAETLRTLPGRDVRSGVAELLKTFLIDDREGCYARAVHLFSSPEREDKGDSWQELVFAAAAVKAGVVGRDPYERGERRKLNLGHTFAHAIEHEARTRGDDVTHGEAVAMGMVLAARLADRLYGKAGAADAGRVPSGTDWCTGCAGSCPGYVSWHGMEERLRADFTAVGLPVDSPYPLETLAAAMEKDKKAGDGAVRFQLPVAVGRVEECLLPVREVVRLMSGNI